MPPVGERRNVPLVGRTDERLAIAVPMPALSAASRARQNAVPVVASVRCGKSGTTTTAPSPSAERRRISSCSEARRSGRRS